jgi:hypothetical protein
MAWIQPELAWTAEDIPSASDFNRIEGNTDYLKTGLDAEIVARAAADTAETNARIAADAVVQGSVTTETNNRVAAVAQEVIDRNAAIGVAVASEAGTRAANDNAIINGTTLINARLAVYGSGLPAAGAAYAGRLAYWVDGSNYGYLSMCIRTGASTYAWKMIVSA